MDQQYDVIVCGTGLVQCILSGLLSLQGHFKLQGKKVLHIDRNKYYGGQGASLNLTHLWELFRQSTQVPKQYGPNREWNIDLIPKYIMSGGKLVKILLKTKVSKYLEWKSQFYLLGIDGTYVFQTKQPGFFSKGGWRIQKVPATDQEALRSDLMGLFEKRRCKKFFQYVQGIQFNNSKTWGGYDIKTLKGSDILKKFQLEPNTIDFIGHAVALYTDDSFSQLPAQKLIQKIRLYMDSIGKYGDSPFIYPIYGLGGIPEGFSRLCAVNGGTFMLKQDIDEILFNNGKVCGVRSGDQKCPCKMVICDPTYVLKTGLQKRVKSVGKIIRCICIMNHMIPGTKDVPSVQIIIPQKQIKRKNDIYIMMVSDIHSVSMKGYSIAIISTKIQTNNPQKEIEFAYELIGSVKQKFIKITEEYVPVSDDISDGLVITSSFDPTSHFENQTQQVLKLYKLISGKELDLQNLPQDQDQ